MEKRDGKIERAQVVAGRKPRIQGADARSVKLQNRMKSARALVRRRCTARLRGSMNDITVRVPGTTANLGPGFDCLGVALQICFSRRHRRRRLRLNGKLSATCRSRGGWAAASLSAWACCMG